MYIKIYFNDKPLYLCNSMDAEIAALIRQENSVFMNSSDAASVKDMIALMQSEKLQIGIFLHSELEEVMNMFFKKFTLIKAAGGAVFNPQQELLLIFRREKWDLPKGKLDDGESIEACAIREVQEETGLRDIVITAPLTITYHIYTEGEKQMLKESHWYKMEATANQELIPQAEEDITAIKWVPIPLLQHYIPHTYASIATVFSQIIDNT